MFNLFSHYLGGHEGVSDNDLLGANVLNHHNEVHHPFQTHLSFVVHACQLLLVLPAHRWNLQTRLKCPREYQTKLVLQAHLDLLMGDKLRFDGNRVPLLVFIRFLFIEFLLLLLEEVVLICAGHEQFFNSLHHKNMLLARGE
jgi:hypothetical protein